MSKGFAPSENWRLDVVTWYSAWGHHRTHREAKTSPYENVVAPMPPDARVPCTPSCMGSTQNVRCIHEPYPWGVSKPLTSSTLSV